ncbi:MAG: insulinase family protein [Anaerolineae bacterium]|jgi:hypothetical protein|nr:insulinase family protein [Anaerolineae bacterium]
MTTLIHGFELIQSREIPEMNTRARLFRHVRTGAELLSLENADENKSFGIAFKTPPDDSTGLPHILEHSVLGGSRKYRTREPFVTLLKTSLNTFLNAMTFPDMTIYPVASTNLKDFWNLVDVYLDAVFYPTITETTLQQEGWHHETTGPDAPLTYKGVVFNEMKGVYSTPEAVLETLAQRELLPDTPYRHDSGGDPAVIPDLTYAQFKAFHETYYHPSNARIFFYGDDDPAERLRRIDAFITDFAAGPAAAPLPLQPRFAAPRTYTGRYDAGAADADADDKGFVKVSWLLAEVTDAASMMALELLAHILVATPASPLRKALIDSGLGEDLVGEGLDPYKREASFAVGLKGIAPAEAGEVEALILATLTDLAENGIDPATIAASLNQIEFMLREKNSGQFPRGLMAFIGILPAWLHGGDPLDHLAFEAPLSALKARYAADPRYFENLIGQYLLNNPHRSTVILQPDPQVKLEREAAEKDRLARERAALSPDGLAAVQTTMAELERIQTTPDTPEQIATIPTLRLSDLERQTKPVPTAALTLHGSTVLYHDLPTGGVAYLDLGFDLYTLPAQYLPYVDLFGRALTELGTTTQDFVQISQRIGAETGGIYHEVFTSVRYGAAGSVAYSFLRAKAMLTGSAALFSLLHDLLLTVKLDNQERFLQMVLEEKAGHEGGLMMGGHMIVNQRLRAHYDDAGWLSEQLNGVSNLFFVRELAQRIEQDWPSVLADLEAIRALLINRHSLVVNVTMAADDWQRFRPELEAFLHALPAAPVTRHTWQRSTTPPAEGLAVPAQVNFVGKGGSLFQAGYRLRGSQVVILKHMNLDYIWSKIRVQGGAYGGRAQFNPFSGVLTFWSYRDPNLAGTLHNFDGAADYLRGLSLSADDLEKAIIGAIGEVDRYLLPDAKGLLATQRYLTGYTDALRQQARDEIFATTLADFHAFGAALAALSEQARVAVVGSPDSLQAATGQPGLPLTITPVL